MLFPLYFTAGKDESTEDWKQLVTSQNNVLREQALKERSTDLEIERIESEIHRWRSKAHGKNYVQVNYIHYSYQNCN